MKYLLRFFQPGFFQLGFLQLGFRRLVFSALLIFAAIGHSGCDDSAKDLIDLALNQPDRERIDTTRMGVNNFFVDPEFGSIQSQFLEIRDTLNLRFVRVLFAWTNQVQPSPGASPFYGFYDEIAASIPPGIDVIAVLVHTPDWMANPANYTTGNPRTEFVQRWVRPTVARYASNNSIIGWEVWNEPDLTLFAGDAALGLDAPENYFEMLTSASAAIRAVDPGSLVVLAATQAINQQFPDRLNYNRLLRDLGAEAFADIWNVHYYSKNYETIVTSNGVASFLNDVQLPIWITESGEEGPNNQLPYVQEVWPFLRNEVPGIDRIYYYQFGETVPADVNFGLRTTDPVFPVSDLYIRLRDGIAE